MDTLSDTTQALIARLWATFQPLAVERVGIVAAYLTTGACPPRDAATSAPDRTGTSPWAQARQAAHDLAGSLGSYGRPEGSALAARLEAVLDGHGDVADAPALLAAIEREVSR